MDKVKVLIAVDPQVVPNLPLVGGGYEISVSSVFTLIFRR